MGGMFEDCLKFVGLKWMEKAVDDPVVMEALGLDPILSFLIPVLSFVTPPSRRSSTLRLCSFFI